MTAILDGTNLRGGISSPEEGKDDLELHQHDDVIIHCDMGHS